MVTATSTNPLSNVAGIGADAARARTNTTNSSEAATEDRFLKLLVAQMQNQDPLNPLDNAQVTSQMAQINTVSGLDKLNSTVQGLNAQFVQLQALQGAALVGREVSVSGDRMQVRGGQAEAGFELAAPADKVKVEVLSSAGIVLDTLHLGAQAAGRHQFEWAAKNQPDGSSLRFRVTATSSSAAVAANPLMRDVVEAVSSTGQGLSLQLRASGSTAYDAIKSFH
jgi:flagellar basal-body rod modification protein FlgD